MGIRWIFACLAEVKVGDLAKTTGYEEDNKDVDVYLWGDAKEEDYTAKATISYKDLCNPYEIEEGELDR